MPFFIKVVGAKKPSSQLTREFVDVDTPGIFSSIESPNSFVYSEVRRGLSLTIIEEQKNKGFKLERCIYQSGREGTKLDGIVRQGRITKVCRKISVRII